MQRTVFEIANSICEVLGAKQAGATPAGERDIGRNAILFPQIADLVNAFVERRVELKGGSRVEEIALEKYRNIVEARLLDALRTETGEPIFRPRIEKYRPVGSTRDVFFRTSKACQPTVRSHVSHVVVDSGLETQAAFYLESEELANAVVAYAKNDHLDFNILYQVNENPRVYIPDFIVRISTVKGGEVNLVLEMKGWNNEDARAKASAASRWVDAVTHHGGFGTWVYKVVTEASEIPKLVLSIHQRGS